MNTKAKKCNKEVFNPKIGKQSCGRESKHSGACEYVPKQSHTPTPWDYDSLTNKGYRISCQSMPLINRTIAMLPDDDLQDQANASFIVQACNNHYHLLKALKLMIHNPKENLEWAKEAILNAEGK